MAQQGRHAAFGKRSNPVTIRLRKLCHENNINKFSTLDRYNAQVCRPSCTAGPVRTVAYGVGVQTPLPNLPRHNSAAEPASDRYAVFEAGSWARPVP